MKVAITTSSFAQYSQVPLELLRNNNINYTLNPYGRTLSEAETMLAYQECVGVVAGTEPISTAVLDNAPQLKVISRCGVGVDNIAIEAAQLKQIQIRTTPDGPTQAVVELTLGFALDLLRNISLMDREVRAQTWKKRMGHLLQGKQLGIIGFGRIGQAVGASFKLLGCQISYYDPLPIAVPQEQFQAASLQDILANSDIISLHCTKPLGSNYLITDQAINKIKKGALLINASRGGLIDEEALYQALLSKHLGGAALDVFIQEPYRGKLAGLSNVVLTPHIGSYAQESRIRMESDAVLNLLQVLGINPSSSRAVPETL